MSTASIHETPPIRLAVVGAGPVGLTLALLASQRLPSAQVQLFDARPLERDVSADPRTLALSLGSVQLLQRLGVWEPQAAQPIAEVHVSQQPPSLPAWLSGLAGEPVVRIRAVDEAVPMLGAVLSYDAIVAPLQRAWSAACAREPGRLVSRFGTPVASLKALRRAGDGRVAAVEIDAGIAEDVDLAVVAEGGVFGAAETAAAAPPRGLSALRSDYGQTAWVGSVTLHGGRRGVAYERFTRHGPAALLPLPVPERPQAKDMRRPPPEGNEKVGGNTARFHGEGAGRAALVWCVDRATDPVRELNDAQRLAVLGSLFAAEAGRIVALSPLKDFALGVTARPMLTEGRTVYIGNAAQTLHPVAGQGLNLGLRDAFELVRALSAAGDGDIDAVLRRLEWQRAPDRWALIAATDFLARSFTWQLPGAGPARGLGLAALQALPPLKSALTRQMLYGRR